MSSRPFHDIKYVPKKAKTVDIKEIKKIYVRNGELVGFFSGYDNYFYEVLETFDEKLSYILSSIAHYARESSIETFYNNKYFKWLEEVVKEILDANISISNEEHYISTIENQGFDSMDNYFNKDEHEFKLMIANLLFNEDMVIIIGNYRG